MAERTGIRRLSRALTSTWAAAWALGLLLFAIVVIGQESRLRRGEVEAELALRAAAVYGLVWFDVDGTFHDEVLAAEDWLDDELIDLWVLEPGEPPVVHLGPANGDAADPTLLAIARQVVRDQDAVDRAEGDTLWHGIPTYLEGEDGDAHAAILAVQQEATTGGLTAFARQVIGWAAALGALGIGVGVLLARWSVRPVVRTLEQRERFLVAAAHELRSPVASLLAVCASGEAGDEPADQALGRASRLAQRTAGVVDDLLLYARLEAGHAELERRPVRLDLLVEATLPDDVEFTEQDETVVEVDPDLVTVAVRNLVRNAEVHGGGLVRVEVEGPSLVVDDAGPGYPAEILELAKGPFSFAPSKGGSGVGLATARMIAELHGGRLALENLPDGGARTVLDLRQVVLRWHP